MAINEQIAELERRWPGSVRTAVERTLALAPEKDVLGIIPSVVLQADGLMLTRVLLVTASYLTETQLGPDELSTDFVAKSTIVNYRIRIWDHEIPAGEGAVKRFSLAQVVLIHDISPSFRTELSYVGDDREDWLASVLRVIPIELVRRSAAPLCDAPSVRTAVPQERAV
jgi:hypothetical protein